MDKMEKSLYLTQREHKEVFSQDDPRTNFVHDRVESFTQRHFAV